VLDMVRLADHAHQAGETGRMTQLASFFKSPMDVDEHDFFKQFAWLREYLCKAASAAPRRTRKRVTR